MRTLTPTLTLTLASLIALSTLTAHAQDYVPAVAPASEPALLRTTGPRVRAGFDTAPFIGGNGSGPLMGVSTHARVGVQVNDWFAAYYQAGGIFGGEVNLCVLYCPSGSKELFLHTSSILAEATLGDLFQIAAGPSIGLGVDRGASVVAPGFALRTAFTFGGDGIGTRRGFSIGAQLDMLYVGGQSWDTVGSLTFGWDTF